MQLAWPTSSVGSLQLRIFLPFHLHPAAFPLRLPLEAFFFSHTADTLYTRCKFLYLFHGFFILLFVKTVCKCILREFPIQACKIPLSLIQEAHAVKYLRSQEGDVGEKPVSELWEISPVCAAFWTRVSGAYVVCTLVLWIWTAKLKTKTSGSLSQYAYILFLWDKFEQSWIQISQLIFLA